MPVPAHRACAAFKIHNRRSLLSRSYVQFPFHVGCYGVYRNAGSAEAEAFRMVRALSES